MRAPPQLAVEIKAEVLQSIRQHARSSMNAEVCGVLIGTSDRSVTKVQACISGQGAAQGGAHVTFTQETWAHIYRVKDRQFPLASIVGWYHSHPGFGIFLSEFDLFIHRNYFSNLGQIAWVYDPHSDEEGCFIWVGGEICRASSLMLTDGRKEQDGSSEYNKLPVVGNSDSILPVIAEKVKKRRWSKRWVVCGAMVVGIILGFLFGRLSVSHGQNHFSHFPNKGPQPVILNGSKIDVSGTNVVRSSGARVPRLKDTNTNTPPANQTNAPSASASRTNVGTRIDGGKKQ